MFFFFHILIGFLIGLLIGDILHDRRWAIPCAVGAALPDLLDKPLGYVIFSATIHNGRIWFHGLLALLIVFGVGVMAWKYRSTPVGLGAALGMLSHQLLDFMWLQPVSWLYPALGPFPKIYQAIDIFQLLMRELANPSEWVMLGVVAIGLVIFFRRNRTEQEDGRYYTVLRIFLVLSLITLAAISITFYGIE